MMMSSQSPSEIDRAAEKYVRLALAVGVHEPDYVDAFYGPQSWKTAANEKRTPMPEIRDQAQALLSDLNELKEPTQKMDQWRLQSLKKHLHALNTFVEIKLGRKMTFDQESLALYDSVAPPVNEAELENVFQQLEQLLPGEGTIQDRYQTFRRKFTIPMDRLTRVFDLALQECRTRTLAHIDLPQQETFTVELVQKKPWSGYNWYKGNYKSLIEINTDLPVYMDRALDLAAHEGYPGHHVYNVLLERELRRKQDWVEFSVYALYSPQSFLAEGSANYGIKIVLPEQERIEFETKVLFPAAGLNQNEAESYHRVLKLLPKLNHAGNESARRFTYGEWDAEQAIQWWMKYSLYSREAAEKRLDFVRRYRSYVINYNAGEDIVARYVESRANTPEERWRVFTELLSSPRQAASLIEAR